MSESAMKESTLSDRNRKLTITLVSIAVFLYWIALYIYVSTLSTYVESKTDSLAMVGVVISMYGLWQAVIRLPLGIAADWLGDRKTFVIIGFALTGLGAYIMGVSDGVTGLIIGRAVTGLAAGTWVPLVALFSGLFPPEDAVRSSALLTLIGSVGRMLSTGMTGSLNAIGGYSLPFFLAAGAAALAVLVVLPIREPKRPGKHLSLKELWALISRRDVMLPTLLSTVAQYTNWAATFGFVPILAKQLGATSVGLSVLLSMNIALLTAGNLVATTVVRKLGPKRMVYASFIVLCSGVAIAASAPGLPLLFIGQFMIGFAQGVGYPTLMGLSIRYVDDSQRTVAMGLHQAVYAIGMFAGPALSGTLADAMGIRPMLGVTAGVALVVGVLLARHLTAESPA